MESIPCVVQPGTPDSCGGAAMSACSRTASGTTLTGLATGPAMTRYVVLLRAVNVGGTGKLPMSELRAWCENAGFTNVRTYIASGNVVFTSKLSEKAVQKAIAQRLEKRAGKQVAVMVRTAAQMAAVLAENPFSAAPGNRVTAIFLEYPPPSDALEHATGVGDEEIALGRREIYVRYGDGMAGSRLKIPAAKAGTARNMNTIAKLAAMAAQPA